MNSIPKDPYADALLLNLKSSMPGAIIKKDAYAEALLNGSPGGTASSLFPVDVEAPVNATPKM